MKRLLIIFLFVSLILLSGCNSINKLVGLSQGQQTAPVVSKNTTPSIKFYCTIDERVCFVDNMLVSLGNDTYVLYLPIKKDDVRNG